MAIGQTIVQNVRKIIYKIAFSETTGMGDYLPYTLKEGMVLIQPFSARQPGLSELLLSFSSVAHLSADSDIQIAVTIHDPDKDKIILSKVLRGNHINVFTRTILRVPAGLFYSGRTYEMRLTIEKLNPELGVKIHMIQQTEDELIINRHPSGMALALVHAYTRLNTFPLLVALLLLGLAVSLFGFPMMMVSRLFTNLPLLPLFLAPAGTLLIAELLNTLNEHFLLKAKLFLISYLIILFFQGMLLSVTGYPQTAVFLTMLLFSILSIANHLKQFFRGDPLYAADIASFGMVMKTGGQLVYEVQIRFVLAFLSILVYFGIFQHQENQPALPWQRLVWFGAAFFGGFLIAWLIIFNTRIAISKLGIGNHPWNPMSDYSKCGFVVPFCRSIRELFIFSPKKAARIPEHFYQLPIQPVAAVAGSLRNDLPEKPNIIVIMSESFCDFRNIRPFTVSEPVMPFYDRLRQLDPVISGNLLVPVFGGGTSNTEFEYLTGSSMYFFSDASVPYLNYFRKPVHGVPDLLRQQGYRCVAIHPYDPTFYNRNVVYPMMGFERFISMEEFPKNKQLDHYVRDQADYEMILQQIRSKKPEDRLFVFSVTMQNHFPYHGTEENQESLRYHIKLPELTDAEGVELFLSKLRESDDALKYLLHELEQLDEPTLLVFFGDHLPGNNRSFNSFFCDLYGQPLATLGFEETKKLFETPYLIWANYELPKLKAPLISSNFLGLATLDLAGATHSSYYGFLSELHANIQATGNKFIQTYDKIYEPGNTPEDLTDLMNRYWHYQYDNIIKPVKSGT